jgi:acetyl-CoA carboxylase carboxyl transferase subunit beta
MDWFKRKNTSLDTTKRKDIPDGLWIKCPGCGEIIYRREVEKNSHVCTNCRHHFRINAGQYLELLADPGTFKEEFGNLRSGNPLKFRDRLPYNERLEKARKKTGLSEAVVVGTCRIGGWDTALGVMDFHFFGGSVGSVVGERLGRLIKLATQRRLPLVIVSSSGGMRMQEGALSLMQMAKTSALLQRYSRTGLPFISVLTDPTTGGTTASFSMLGDLIISEPGALIGFAGPNVIKNTIHQDLPEGFQRAEFLLEHGFLDMIVPRQQLKQQIITFLEYLGPHENTAHQ